MSASCQTMIFFDTPCMTPPDSKTLVKSCCTVKEECHSQEAHRCEPSNVAAFASADSLLRVNPQFSRWRKDWRGTRHLITHHCYMCACLQVCVCLIQQLLMKAVSSEATWEATLDATWNNNPVCVCVRVWERGCFPRGDCDTAVSPQGDEVNLLCSQSSWPSDENSVIIYLLFGMSDTLQRSQTVGHAGDLWFKLKTSINQQCRHYTDTSKM